MRLSIIAILFFGLALFSMPAIVRADNPSQGAYGSTTPSTATAQPPSGPYAWSTVFGGSCSDYNCWFSKVWAYAMAIVVPLSTLMLIYAGILWTTSSGDPSKIEKSKKIIIGVVSGILLLVFARVFIVNIIGLDSFFWNI